MYVIDNSLCNIDFCKKATDKLVREYIAALFESGADYVEIDGKAVEYLQNVHTKDRFIFRVEEPKDFEVLTRQKFAYVVLPLNMLIAAEKFPSLNSIIEIDGSGYTSDEIASLCVKVQQSSGVSAIRITKNFRDGVNELENLLKKADDCEISLPLDICPLNIDLNGISNALYAYMNNFSGMVTLSFSSHYLYTPFESFILYAKSKYGDYAGKKEIQHTIAALYVSATRYDLISEYPSIALMNISSTIKNCEEYTLKPDDYTASGYSREPRRRVKSPKDKKPTYTKIKQKYFDENDIDDELCQSISDAVDDANMGVYNSSYKNLKYKI